MRTKPFLLPLLLLALALPAAAAVPDNRARDYAACMANARTKPKEAFDQAVAWKDLGGGAAAEHCAAVALLNLGHHKEAAQRLEGLAQRVRQEPGFKARLLAQAAQAWLLAGDPARAEAALTSALALQADSADLYIDRAAARAARKDYKAAAMDLDRAIGLAPRRADAHAFRASAHRFLENLDKALADAEQALSIEPDLPEALLERGILRRLKNDDKGARKDWMRLLQVAPDGEAAVEARANLEKMDVKPGK